MLLLLRIQQSRPQAAQLQTQPNPAQPIGVVTADVGGCPLVPSLTKITEEPDNSIQYAASTPNTSPVPVSQEYTPVPQRARYARFTCYARVPHVPGTI